MTSVELAASTNGDLTEAWIGLVGVAVGALVVGIFSWITTGKMLRHQSDALEKTLEAEFQKLRAEYVLKVYQEFSKALTRARDQLAGRDPVESWFDVIETFHWAYPFLLPRTIQEFQAEVLSLEAGKFDHPELQTRLAGVLDKAKHDLGSIRTVVSK